ncbi:MAG: hypothetical protein AAFN93_01775 [Bacteroidota bacterium]
MTLFFNILSLSLFSALIWLLYKHYKDHPMQSAMFVGMFLKVSSGLLLGVLYLHYYPSGDTWTYFSEATKLSELARGDVGSYLSALMDSQGRPLAMQFYNQPRALFFVKILSAVCLLTYDNYWLSSVYFSLFSFSGLWVLANVLIRINNNKTAALIAFILFPSVLFWSSGILKESIAIGSLAFLTASILQYSHRLKRLGVIWLLLDVLLIYLLWRTKYYYAGIFLLAVIPLILTFVIKHWLSEMLSSARAQILLFITLSLVTLIGVSMLHPNFYFSRIIKVIVDNHDLMVANSAYMDIIHFDELSTSISSILKNTPLAFVSGLFRPFVGESTAPLKILIGLENLVLLFLLITSFFYFPKNISDEARIYLFALILYVVIMAILLALSTPNFGTLTRYKVGFLPYLVYIISVENGLVKRLNEKLF